MHYTHPRETGAGFKFLQSHAASGVDKERQEEQWSDLTEDLLQEWAREWHLRNAAHNHAHAWWKRFFYFIEVPKVALPLLVATIWNGLPVAEGTPLATATMATSGTLNALAALLQADAKAERHMHTAHRYADLISDAEELLSKERSFRADVDVSIQGFKMRSDALLRSSPHVHVDLD